MVTILIHLGEHEETAPESGSHIGGYGVRRNPRWPLERATGIEPATSSLGS
jgi:hypothetical protein